MALPYMSGCWDRELARFGSSRLAGLESTRVQPRNMELRLYINGGRMKLQTLDQMPSSQPASRYLRLYLLGARNRETASEQACRFLATGPLSLTI